MSSRFRFKAADQTATRNGLLRFPVGARVQFTTGAHTGACGRVTQHHWPKKGYLSVEFDQSRLTRNGVVDGVAVNADAAAGALVRLPSVSGGYTR